MLLILNLQFPVDVDKLMEVFDVVSSFFSLLGIKLPGWTAHGRHYGQMFCFSNKILVMLEIMRCCVISLHSSFCHLYIYFDRYFFVYLLF